MFIALFFLFVFSSFPFGIDAVNCESEKNDIQKCYFDFLQIYNFSSSILPPFDNFSGYLNEKDQSWEGELFICKNGMTLVNCINKTGVEITPECFSTIFDSSIDDSIGYVSYYYLARYRCQGKGFQEFKDTYNCSKTMKDCPGKTDSCFSIKTFMECMKKQATDKCGPEYSDFLTNSLQILINVTYNSCLPTDVSNPSNPTSNNPTIWISVTAFIIASSLIIIVVIILKYRKKRKRENNKFEDEYQMTTTISPQITHSYHNLFIPETKIIVDFEKILGRGSTATVYAAVLEQTKSDAKQVAFKIPIQTRMDYFEEFCHELKIATLLKNHSTICAATSWTLYRELPCLIFEKMDTDLSSFVKRYNETEKVEEFPPTKLFLQFLWQISDALSFIASKKLVHRDVAARNILIAYPNIAKISDFGLCSEFDESSSIYLSSLYKKLPIKWLPLESLSERIFSEKSDVWSFGILMFEMWSKGELPYQNLNYNEQMEFLKSGQRLSIPKDMREDIGEIMLSCWKEDQKDRPTFVKIKQSLENLLQEETANYGYLSI